MEEIFKVEIISPEKVIFLDNATLVTLPSYEGEMSVLKDHISIITFLRPGIIKVQKNDGNFERFFVQDGIIEYFNDSLIVLSTSAVNVKNISKEFIDALNNDTKNKLANKDVTDHDRYLLNHKLDVLNDLRV